MFGRTEKVEILKQNGGTWDVYSTNSTIYNVLDQVKEVKQIVGSNGTAQTATFDYDGYARLWRRKLPIEGTSSSGTKINYYDDDTVHTVTDSREVISTYTYNNRGLVQNITFNTGGNPSIAAYGPVSFTYDESGNRLTMSDGFGNTTYQYDSLSRMDWERRYFNDLNQNHYLYYKYNLMGQVKEVKDDFDDVIYYNLDKVGRVASVTGEFLGSGEQYQFTSSQSASLIKYRAWGGIKQMTYGNISKTIIGYDDRMRTQSFEVTDVLREPSDPDQSFLAMKTEHEYHGDSKPKYIKDHKNSGSWFENDDGLIKRPGQGMLPLLCVTKQSLARTVHH